MADLNTDGPDPNSEAAKIRAEMIERMRAESDPDTVLQNLDTVTGEGQTAENLLDQVRKKTDEGREANEQTGSFLDKLAALNPWAEAGSSTSKQSTPPPTSVRSRDGKQEVLPPDGGAGATTAGVVPDVDLPTPQKRPEPEAAEIEVAQIDPEFQSKIDQLSPTERIDFCVELLRAGRKAEFNAIRPTGRIDLRGRDFQRLDLSGVDFRHADLSRAILSTSNLSGALFQHANLDRADLIKTVLSGAKFYKATLRYADLSNVLHADKAEFIEANCRGAEFRKGNFSGSYFTDASLVTATMSEAKFSGSDLERARLVGAILTRANFHKANLHKARLFQANGQDVDFTDSNLTDAEATQTYFTSSEEQHADGHALCTNFNGAWVKGFDHGGNIQDVDLLHAISDGYPPEGLFQVSPEPDQGKVLIHGIPGTDKVLYDAAFEELHELIGLDDAKEQVRNYTNLVEASKTRSRLFGLPEFKYNLHTVIYGPPGTGKTTVASILVRLNHALGLLSKGHIVETDKSGFISGFAGQTLGKTNDTIDSALGGGLIADEIYALTESKNDDYAKDAMAVLIKRLWDDRDKFQAIFIGYEKQMEAFMDANPGMRRRIGSPIYCHAQTSGQLIDVMKLNLDKTVLRYTPEFLGAASMMFAATRKVEDENFGNAGTVVKSIERQVLQMATRLKEQGLIENEEAQKTPTHDDLPFEEFTGLSSDRFPKLEELKWIAQDGAEYGVKELPLDGDFPSLSDESVRLIEQTVEAHEKEEVHV